VVPLFTTHGKTLALDVLKTGMDVAEDVLGGKHDFKESVVVADRLSRIKLPTVGTDVVSCR